MNGPQPRWPGTATVSLLAALTSWVALWSWSGFVERPGRFLAPALVVVLLVAVTGTLLRSSRVPALLVLPAQASVVGLWLNHLWAEPQSVAGWLPTSDSLREVSLRLQEGAAVAQEYVAPVPADAAEQLVPLLLVAAAGTALLVDLLACGLRRVPASGLPLLAVYTAPVSILDGVPWWGFAAGALTFLLLLSTDETRRLSAWGRVVPAPGERSGVASRISTETVRSSARKIGFTATGLALVVPVLTPTLGTSIFGGGVGGDGGDGDTVAISNPMVDLRRDLTRGRDVDLVTVRTSDPDPSYLRISVLDDFDGRTWKPSTRDIPSEQRAVGRLPRPQGLSSGVPQSLVPYEIETTPAFSSQWLPTPFPISSIQVEGDWRYDEDTMDFISADEGVDAGGISYSLESLEIEPSARYLADSGAPPRQLAEDYTELPDDMPEFIPGLAEQVTREGETKFEKAVLLQSWFRQDGGFDYSLDRVEGNGTDDLAAFLADRPGGRVGYCEQFAASMAVMGRLLDIPSRVAVGFLRPDRVAQEGAAEPARATTYVYSAHDLHAWPEMFFEGAGWVRFEPTPPDRATSVPGYTAPGAVDRGPDPAAPTDAATEAPNLPDRSDEGAMPTAGAGDGGGGSTAATVIGRGLAVVLVPLLLVSPRLARSLVRRRRWTRAGTPAATAEAAWAELRDSTIDLGLPWDDTVTPRNRARALVRLFPGHQADAIRALERIVVHLERARYARSLDSVPDLRRDVERCVAALRQGVDGTGRLRADWLPRSLSHGLPEDLRRFRSARPALEPDAGIDHAV